MKNFKEFLVENKEGQGGVSLNMFKKFIDNDDHDQIQKIMPKDHAYHKFLKMAENHRKLKDSTYNKKWTLMNSKEQIKDPEYLKYQEHSGLADQNFSSAKTAARKYLHKRMDEIIM